MGGSVREEAEVSRMLHIRCILEVFCSLALMAPAASVASSKGPRVPFACGSALGRPGNVVTLQR